MALAQPGQSINQRQASLDSRIDVGVANGSLTAAEAAQLRAEFRGIAQLEAQYRASNGLSPAERADLDTRFDRLSTRVALNRNDNQNRPAANMAGQGVNERQANLDQRIDTGVANGALTRVEANQLRRELQGIARLEAQYRVSGRSLSRAERLDLDRRFDALSSRIRIERNDGDQRWTNLDQRQAQFTARLNQAVALNRISRPAAYQLRTEFSSLARLERQYRMSGGGITPAERAELNRRFDRMQANYRASLGTGRSTPFADLFEQLLGVR